MDSYSYTLNRIDIVTAVDGDWDQFNDTNAGKKNTLRDAVIGSSIWTFFNSTELKSVYKHIFNKVRQDSVAIDIPFRCDSPTLKRYMQLLIEPLPDRGLKVTSSIIRTEPRNYQALLDQDVSRTDEYINVCSICRRFSYQEDRWEEAEDMINRAGHFTDDLIPKLKERVCSDCAEIVPGLDSILTLSGSFVESKDEMLPLIVFLHGELQAEHIFRLQAPPRMVSSGKLLDQNSFYLLTPIKQNTRLWDDRMVLNLIIETIKNNNIDKNRVYITGISSGGAAAWRILNNSRELFAAIISLATIPTLSKPKEYGEIGFYLGVGERDPITNKENFTNVIQKLSENSANVQSTIYPNVGHECWLHAYNDKKLWEWLFKQKRVS